MVGMVVFMFDQRPIRQNTIFGWASLADWRLSVLGPYRFLVVTYVDPEGLGFDIANVVLLLDLEGFAKAHLPILLIDGLCVFRLLLWGTSYPKLPFLGVG